jgi:hypothetical protein
MQSQINTTSRLLCDISKSLRFEHVEKHQGAILRQVILR